MTDLQDAILDRLVGTRVGVNWPDGPLTIAAEVVGGSKPIQFGVTDGDRGAKSEIARRLGYPVLLIEAMQGANRAFAAEDDRRGFAMAVFRKVSVGGKALRLSALDQVRIAGQLAVRAHPYVCGANTCPVPEALKKLIEANEVTTRLLHEAEDARCKTANKAIGRFLWIQSNSTSEHRMMQSAYQVVNGLRERRSLGAWCSIRESVRLAASERGMEEAIDCCVEIARKCGVPVGV